MARENVPSIFSTTPNPYNNFKLIIKKKKKKAPDKVGPLVALFDTVFAYSLGERKSAGIIASQTQIHRFWFLELWAPLNQRSQLTSAGPIVLHQTMHPLLVMKLTSYSKPLQWVHNFSPIPFLFIYLFFYRNDRTNPFLINRRIIGWKRFSFLNRIEGKLCAYNNNEKKKNSSLFLTMEAVDQGWIQHLKWVCGRWQ